MSDPTEPANIPQASELSVSKDIKSAVAPIEIDNPEARLAASKPVVILSLLLVLLLASAVRYMNFPHRYETRDMDETGYLDDGLVMWEGMTPPIRVAPAGVETWFTWLYAAARSARAMIHPEPQIAAAQMLIRPFLAIDSVLFDIYQDMSGLHRMYLVVEFMIALGGVYGAFQLARYYGGVGAGILLGGTVAMLPLYVDFAGMTRSYSDAWSFAFLTLYSAAAIRGHRRWIQTGLFLGLAVGSRIELLAIVPMVLWQFWDNPEPGKTWRSLIKSVAVSTIVFFVLAPWMIFQIVGVVRTIASTRFAGWIAVDHPRLTTLKDLTWDQGLAPLLLLTIVGVLLVPRGKRLCRWCLALYVLPLVFSMFSGPYQPMRYQGSAIIAMLCLAGITTGEALRRWPKFAPWLIVIALALPAARTGLYLNERYTGYAAENATDWVEQHVPAGTRVADAVALDLRPPLPTELSSDALWAEVDDADSVRKKFGTALSRFGVSGSYVPRALSEDNMVLDRGFWRRYFILGNPTRTARPRYDLHIFGLSPRAFGIIDLPADFSKNGGVVIWRAGGGYPQELGTPIIGWTSIDHKNGTYIFCSPDVVAKLK